ncbi:MAG TPA: hypothetical protein VGS04_06625 [Nitrososphaerales archaeon]|nr:hypothetical protein [Nitrososphaerales archaeon]
MAFDEDVTSTSYDNWCAVAAFFDGDGCVDVEVRKYTLHWVVSFTDNWPPQVLQIKQFLEAQGLDVGAIRPAGVGAVKFQVAAIESLIRFARGVLETTCLFKKRDELRVMLAYFNSEVTGDQVIEFLNREVTDGARTGKLRMTKLPFTYIVGRRVYKKGYKRIGPSTLAALTEKEKEEIRSRYVNQGLTMYQLAPLYEVSPSTIFKTVRGLKRGSGSPSSG